MSDIVNYNMKREFLIAKVAEEENISEEQAAQLVNKKFSKSDINDIPDEAVLKYYNTESAITDVLSDSKFPLSGSTDTNSGGKDKDNDRPFNISIDGDNPVTNNPHKFNLEPPSRIVPDHNDHHDHKDNKAETSKAEREEERARKKLRKIIKLSTLLLIISCFIPALPGIKPPNFPVLIYDWIVEFSPSFPGKLDRSVGVIFGHLLIIIPAYIGLLMGGVKKYEEDFDDSGLADNLTKYKKSKYIAMAQTINIALFIYLFHYWYPNYPYVLYVYLPVLTFFALNHASASYRMLTQNVKDTGDIVRHLLISEEGLREMEKKGKIKKSETNNITADDILNNLVKSKLRSIFYPIIAVIVSFIAVSIFWANGQSNPLIFSGEILTSAKRIFILFTTPENLFTKATLESITQNELFISSTVVIMLGLSSFFFFIISNRVLFSAAYLRQWWYDNEFYRKSRNELLWIAFTLIVLQIHMVSFLQFGLEYLNIGFMQFNLASAIVVTGTCVLLGCSLPQYKTEKSSVNPDEAKNIFQN